MIEGSKRSEPFYVNSEYAYLAVLCFCFLPMLAVLTFTCDEGWKAHIVPLSFSRHFVKHDFFVHALSLNVFSLFVCCSLSIESTPGEEDEPSLGTQVNDGHLDLKVSKFLFRNLTSFETGQFEQHGRFPTQVTPPSSDSSAATSWPLPLHLRVQRAGHAIPRVSPFPAFSSS